MLSLVDVHLMADDSIKVSYQNISFSLKLPFTSTSNEYSRIQVFITR